MIGLLELSRNGAVFIAAIALLRLLLGKRLPRTAFVVLWLLAAVRLLCPWRAPSPFSVWSLLARARTARPTIVPAVRPLPTAEALPIRTALPNVCDLLGKIWLLGAALLLLGVAALYLSGVRDARRATRMACGAYLCRGLDSPRLVGILRPRILLPEHVREELLPYILLHERVHQRRLDNLWKLLALVAAAVHWFNPAAWVMTALLGRDLEISCDEWALRGLGPEQRRAYALSLIEMAASSRGRSPVTCGFSRNPLEERIRFIMTNRKKSVFALSIASAMILCTTSAFATNAPLAASATPAAVDSETGSGVYKVTVDDGAKAYGSVVVTRTDNGSVDDLVTSLAYYDLEFFTAEEYEAYIEEQKVEMQKQIEAGVLSQETYDKTLRDLQDVLAGIRNGSTMAAKPVESADGSFTEYVVSTPDAANAAGLDIHYTVETDGALSVAISDAELPGGAN